MNEEIEIEGWAPWAVAFLTLVGGWLRVLLLAGKGMGFDETLNVWLANQSIPEMLDWLARIDQHPPFYYLLLHYWTAFQGDSPYYARLLSALFGAGTIPVIFLIGKRISGAGLGLAAAVFLALSPLHIQFAQETNMYTLLAFNAAVAIYSLVRLLTDPLASIPIGSQFRCYLHNWRSPGPVEPDPESDRTFMFDPPRTGWSAWVHRHRLPAFRTIETDLAWAALVFFTAAALLTHHSAILLVATANLFVIGLMLFQTRSRVRLERAGSISAFQAPSLGNWLKAQAGIFLLWSPWLLAFIRQAGRAGEVSGLAEPDWDAVTQTLRSFLNASWPKQAGQAMIMWILGAVLCLGLVYFLKKLSIFLYLAALCVIPFLGGLFVSFNGPGLLDRSLIWVTVPLFLVLAAGIAQLRFRLLMIVVLGILGTNYLFSTGDYYRFYQKEDWGTAAGFVANFTQPGDLVLFNSNLVVIPFNYYFDPYEKLYALRVVKVGVPLDLLASGILEPEMTADDIPALIALLGEHKRVWLVYSREGFTDPDGLIPETLAARFVLTRERDFYGGKVELYETR